MAPASGVALTEKSQLSPTYQVNDGIGHPSPRCLRASVTPRTSYRVHPFDGAAKQMSENLVMELDTHTGRIRRSRCRWWLCGWPRNTLSAWARS
jgi:hypothetical protein